MVDREIAIKALEQARDWAKGKLETGQEPPWSWYQLMKLVETTEAILARMEATSSTENLRQSAEHSGKPLQLVGSTRSQDSVPHHPADVPVQTPM